MKVAIYVRISTVGKGQDVELQLRDLRTYSTARSFDIYAEYVDQGQSGAKDNRPELLRLLDDARKRKFDAILVWRLDRLGRSLKHLINTLDDLRSIGVSFISYQENLDFSTTTGQLMLHLLGAFAEFERHLIRERVKAGVANARSKGKQIGRPKQNIDVDRLLELRKQGLSYKKVGEVVGLSTGLVHKTLKNYSPEPQ